jgi:hypothetical protein
MVVVWLTFRVNFANHLLRDSLFQELPFAVPFLAIFFIFFDDTRQWRPPLKFSSCYHFSCLYCNEATDFGDLFYIRHIRLFILFKQLRGLLDSSF